MTHTITITLDAFALETLLTGKTPGSTISLQDVETKLHRLIAREIVKTKLRSRARDAIHQVTQETAGMMITVSLEVAEPAPDPVPASPAGGEVLPPTPPATEPIGEPQAPLDTLADPG